MSFSTPVFRRARVRTPDVQAFALSDGWKANADIKVNDTLLASGLREGGQPLHDFPFQSDHGHASRRDAGDVRGPSRHESPGAARLQ